MVKQEALPKISEADIKGLSNQQSFDKGREYYRHGAVIELVHQGNQLRGYCEGSHYQPYRVSVTLGQSGIEQTHCTCPYDWGGICKHVVALLLTWVHKPDSFQTLDSLDGLLANRSQADLIALIKEMLKREPDLARLLELPLQPDRQTPLDMDAFRRQINYALNSGDDDDYGYGYSDLSTVVAELEAILDTADRFGEAGDWQNAGAIYALILEEVIAKYQELYDENGDVAIILQRCANSLDDCFIEGQPDPETRRRWLEVLLNAHLKDIEMGGVDLAHPAGELVLGHATDEEWPWIEARVRQAMKTLKHGYSDFAQEALVGFLAERLELKGLEAEADALVLETGSPSQRAFLLLAQKRFAEAIAVARKHFTDLPGLVLRFANALVEAGAGDQAETYLAGLHDSRSWPSYLEWLANRAEEKGDLTAALDWQRQRLQASASLQIYQTVQRLATKLKQWSELRPRLIETLETRGDWSVLMEIAIAEKDIPRALELRGKLTSWLTGRYDMQIAHAAEETRPDVSLKTYLAQVDQLIKNRGRNSYQETARLLIRVRSIYQRLNQQEDWQAYITGLRQNNRNLRALQEELSRAGL